LRDALHYITERALLPINNCVPEWHVLSENSVIAREQGGAMRLAFEWRLRSLEITITVMVTK